LTDRDRKERYVFSGRSHATPSTGIIYNMEIESPADRGTIDRLIADVIDDASIPRSIQQGAPVTLGKVNYNHT